MWKTVLSHLFAHPTTLRRWLGAVKEDGFGNYGFRLEQRESGLCHHSPKRIPRCSCPRAVITTANRNTIMAVVAIAVA